MPGGARNLPDLSRTLGRHEDELSMSTVQLEVSALPHRESWSSRLFAGDNRKLGLSIAMIIVLTALVMPPVWTLLRTSLVESRADLGDGAFTLRHYAQLFAGKDLAGSVWNSIVFSIFATAV